MDDEPGAPDVTIIVYGEPAPQGSKKLVGHDSKGRGILTESSAKVKPWRQDVVSFAIDGRNRGQWTPITGPCRLQVVFTLRKPKSAPVRRRAYPCGRPDLSKLIRSTEDALTTAGVWEDDGRVVEISHAAKTYPGGHEFALASTGAVIRIWSMEPRGEAVPAPILPRQKKKK